MNSGDASNSKVGQASSGATPPPPASASSASPRPAAPPPSHQHTISTTQQVKICVVGSPGAHKQQLLQQMLSLTQPATTATGAGERLPTVSSASPDTEDAFWQDCLSTVVLDVGGGSSASSATSQRRVVLTLRISSDTAVSVELVNCFTAVTPCGSLMDTVYDNRTSTTGGGGAEGKKADAPLRCSICQQANTSRCSRPFTALLDRLDLVTAHAWLIVLDVTSMESYETAVALAATLLKSGGRSVDGEGLDTNDGISDSSSFGGGSGDDRDPLFVGALLAVTDNVGDVAVGKRPRRISRDQCVQLAHAWGMPMFEHPSSKRVKETIEEIIKKTLLARRF